MPAVKLTPTREHPVPFSTEEAKPKTLVDEIQVAGETAELMVELGASLEVDEDTAKQEKQLLEEVVRRQKKTPLKSINTAYAAKAFLTTYGQELAFDVAAARAAITSKLMEIANCGDTKFELRALELLGKHSDIGLFTERSEITVNYKTPEDLENAIKERVKRLLNADVIDVTPLGLDLDEELGVASAEEIEKAQKTEKTKKTEKTEKTEKLGEERAPMEVIKERVRKINTPKKKTKTGKGGGGTEGGEEAA